MSKFSKVFPKIGNFPRNLYVYEVMDKKRFIPYDLKKRASPRNADIEICTKIMISRNVVFVDMLIFSYILAKSDFFKVILK